MGAKEMESEGMLMPLLLPFPGHSLGLGLLLLSPQPETGKRESKLILTEWRRDQPPRHLCGPQFLSWVLQRRQLWGRGIVGHPGLSGRDPPPRVVGCTGPLSTQPVQPPAWSASCSEPPGWLGTPRAKPTLRPLVCLNPRSQWARSKAKGFQL